MTVYRIEFIGGPLDGRWAEGDDPPEIFEAPAPFGIDRGGEMVRYRRVRTPEGHPIAEYLGYVNDLE